VRIPGIFPVTGGEVFPSTQAAPVLVEKLAPRLDLAALAGAAEAPGGPLPAPGGIAWLLGPLACLWLAVAAVGMGLLLAWYLAAGRRLRAGGRAAGDRLAACYRRAVAEQPGTGRSRLMVSASISSPAVFGWFRPRVCVPAGLESRLSEGELMHVLRHELAHVRRHDHQFCLALQVVRLLHWFNPLVWLAAAHIDRVRELACDEVAISGLDVRGRRDYGVTLLNLASQPRFALNFPVPGMSRPVKDIKRRIIMIGKPVTRQGLGLALFLAALLLAGCAAVAGNALPVFPSEVRDGGRSIPTDAAAAVGSWKAVDFVYNREEFVPGKPKTIGEALWLRQIGFASDGMVFGKFGNDRLRYSSWRLQGATLLDMTGRTIPWYLSVRDGKEYLALAWEQPVGNTTAGQFGYITRDWYYIFERIDALDLKGFQPERVAPEDDLAPPFVTDPKLVGNWRVDDFTDSMAHYRLGKGGTEPPGMARASFKADGRATIEWQDATPAHSQEITWTTGRLLFPGLRVAMPYRFETIGGRETLWLEWRNGDVIYGGDKPNYYVLVRE
jgi:bla regulator protein BlaR1